jgi:thymidine kinase
MTNLAHHYLMNYDSELKYICSDCGDGTHLIFRLRDKFRDPERDIRFDCICSKCYHELTDKKVKVKFD